jgi:hypothetical protein
VKDENIKCVIDSNLLKIQGNSANMNPSQCKKSIKIFGKCSQRMSLLFFQKLISCTPKTNEVDKVMKEAEN